MTPFSARNIRTRRQLGAAASYSVAPSRAVANARALLRSAVRVKSWRASMVPGACVHVREGKQRGAWWVPPARWQAMP